MLSVGFYLSLKPKYDAIMRYYYYLRRPKRRRNMSRRQSEWERERDKFRHAWSTRSHLTHHSGHSLSSSTSTSTSNVNVDKRVFEIIKIQKCKIGDEASSSTLYHTLTPRTHTHREKYHFNFNEMINCCVAVFGFDYLFFFAHEILVSTIHMRYNNK